MGSNPIRSTMKVRIIYGNSWMYLDEYNQKFYSKVSYKDLFLHQVCMKINDIIFLGYPKYEITNYMHKLENYD